eukprot:12875032-Alexandrium_andersonii.AAC.1
MPESPRGRERTLSAEAHCGPLTAVPKTATVLWESALRTQCTRIFAHSYATRLGDGSEGAPMGLCGG